MSWTRIIEPVYAALTYSHWPSLWYLENKYLHFVVSQQGVSLRQSLLGYYMYAVIAHYSWATTCILVVHHLFQGTTTPYVSICISICIFICISICSSMSIYPYPCLCLYPYLYLSLYLYLYIYLHLHVHLLYIYIHTHIINIYISIYYISFLSLTLSLFLSLSLLVLT